MKKFAIIVKNIGIAFIYVFIASAIIMYFETMDVETTKWTQRFIGIGIGLYINGKIILELQTHKD